MSLESNITKEIVEKMVTQWGRDLTELISKAGIKDAAGNLIENATENVVKDAGQQWIEQVWKEATQQVSKGSSKETAQQTSKGPIKTETKNATKEATKEAIKNTWKKTAARKWLKRWAIWAGTTGWLIWAYNRLNKWKDKDTKNTGGSWTIKTWTETPKGWNSGSKGWSGSGTPKANITWNQLTNQGYPDIVKQVIRGNFGNWQARKQALEKMGYNYNDVQSQVNRAMAWLPYNGVQQTMNNYFNPTTTNTTVNRYVDPNGEWHEGMSQDDFNKVYISEQQDIFNNRRNEATKDGRTASDIFFEYANKYAENPDQYSEQQLEALREFGKHLWYTDGNGNFASDENPYVIDMSFANKKPESKYGSLSGLYGGSNGTSNPTPNNETVVTTSQNWGIVSDRMGAGSYNFWKHGNEIKASENEFATQTLKPHFSL